MSAPDQPASSRPDPLDAVIAECLQHPPGCVGRYAIGKGREVLTMFTTTWCGYCHRLKSGLDRESITFREINIEADEAAAQLVMQVNRGNQTVPTVVFADGTAMTNPSIADVKAKLAA